MARKKPVEADEPSMAESLAKDEPLAAAFVDKFLDDEDALEKPAILKRLALPRQLIWERRMASRSSTRAEVGGHRVPLGQHEARHAAARQVHGQRRAPPGRRPSSRSVCGMAAWRRLI